MTSFSADPPDAASPAPASVAPSVADQLRWTEDATNRFADLLAAADLTAPVESCPGWDLAELAAHLGRVHAWARVALLEGHPNGEPQSPTEPAALPGWYRERAGELVQTLRQIDPDAPAWGFGPKPRTARFWFRRQQHETSMHLWDALGSQRLPVGYGGAGAQAVPLRAADGVDEVVTIFFPRQVRLERISPLDRSLALFATDSGGRWLLAGSGAADQTAPAECTISGPAEPLLLLLWGRLGLDAGVAEGWLRLDGDDCAARAVLAAGVTP
jgi:uncharacterized protein (TIGR03083 family)